MLVPAFAGRGVALAGREIDVEGVLVIVGVTEFVDVRVAVDVLVCVDVGVLVRVGVSVAASSETTIWTYTLAPKGVPFLFARIQ